jgi:hypothetical protein
MLTLYAGKKCDTGVHRYRVIAAMQTVQFSPVTLVQCKHRSSEVRCGDSKQASEQQTLARADNHKAPLQL